MVGSAIVKPLHQNVAKTISEQAESVQQIIDKLETAILQDEWLLRRLTGGTGLFR
jgi:RecA-family ATPase